MKAKITIPAIIFTLLALLAACDQDLVGPDSGSDVPAVKIQASVGSIFTRSNPLEDGPTGTAFNIGDQIAVSASGQPEVIYTLGSDGLWTPPAGQFLKWTSDEMTFSAYYPVSHTSGASSNNVSMSTFALPYIQSDREGQVDHVSWADYMTFSGKLTKTEGRLASIAFKRQMARVRMKIASVGDLLDASKASFHCNIRSQHRNIPADNDAATVYPAKSENMVVGNTITGLVIPGSGQSDAIFSGILVYPDGKSGTNPLSYDLYVKGIPAHEAGKSYTYEVHVGKDKVEIKSVKVEDWVDGTDITGGEAGKTNG